LQLAGSVARSSRHSAFGSLVILDDVPRRWVYVHVHMHMRRALLSQTIVTIEIRQEYSDYVREKRTDANPTVG
jgi:hypothetical protein